MDFGRIYDSISANAPTCENTYTGEDGMLHCSVCHRAVQVRLKHPIHGTERIQNCACDCHMKAYKEAEERKRQDALDRRRRICFAETNMADWSFENDDKKNEKLSNAMLRYVEKFRDFKRDGKGLLLYGPVGTGKTYYAACIANKLIDEGYRAYMTNFARLTNKLQGMFEGKQEFIDSLNDYDLLVIDDLGIERKSESGYMQEIVFNIVDSRYRAGLPMIITTNLLPDEIKNTPDVRYQRIYDRIMERCFPIAVSGASRRRAALKSTHEDMKNMLGL